jgi:hypothetical protein
MANWIGNCGHCGESCDLYDPEYILVTGEAASRDKYNPRQRLHKVFCSLLCLSRWARDQASV